VQTTIDEAIRVRAGVCQDYAHILVALCRYNGIPARYVSGYIHSGNGEVLGAEASYREKSRARATREVFLRIAVTHASREAIDLFARELGAMGLSTAPGLTGIYSGRPKPTPVVKLFTFFIEKAKMPKPRVTIADAAPFEIDVPTDGGYAPPLVNSVGSTDGIPDGPTIDLPLARLAYARSGDKGDSANIAIIARKPEYLPLIRREVTPARVIAELSQLVGGPAERFEAPGIHAVNFLVKDALGGGGMASLRIDPQGKAYGQMTLEMLIPVPEVWAKEIGG